MVSISYRRMTATFIARRSDFILIGLPVLFPGVALLRVFYQKIRFGSCVFLDIVPGLKLFLATTLGRENKDEDAHSAGQPKTNFL